MAELQISGYASKFNEADTSNDMVIHGAFDASLKDLNTSLTPALPMLYGHETKTPIGVWDTIRVDDVGLFVAGRVFDHGKLALRTQRLILSKAVSGLSIGYRARRIEQNPHHGRRLIEVDLWEVSVVAFPMLRTCRIIDIQELQT